MRVGVRHPRGAGAAQPKPVARGGCGAVPAVRGGTARREGGDVAAAAGWVAGVWRGEGAWACAGAAPELHTLTPPPGTHPYPPTSPSSHPPPHPPTHPPTSPSSHPPTHPRAADRVDWLRERALTPAPQAELEALLARANALLEGAGIRCACMHACMYVCRHAGRQAGWVEGGGVGPGAHAGRVPPCLLGAPPHPPQTPAHLHTPTRPPAPPNAHPPPPTRRVQHRRQCLWQRRRARTQAPACGAPPRAAPAGAGKRGGGARAAWPSALAGGGAGAAAAATAAAGRQQQRRRGEAAEAGAPGKQQQQQQQQRRRRRRQWGSSRSAKAALAVAAAAISREAPTHPPTHTSSPWPLGSNIVSAAPVTDLPAPSEERGVGGCGAEGCGTAGAAAEGGGWGERGGEGGGERGGEGRARACEQQGGKGGGGGGREGGDARVKGRLGGARPKHRVHTHTRALKTLLLLGGGGGAVLIGVGRGVRAWAGGEGGLRAPCAPPPPQTQTPLRRPAWCRA